MKNHTKVSQRLIKEQSKSPKNPVSFSNLQKVPLPNFPFLNLLQPKNTILNQYETCDSQSTLKN
jgi:hypothetical protein